jgi:hypothetical protein
MSHARIDALVSQRHAPKASARTALPLPEVANGAYVPEAARKHARAS